MSSQTRTGEIEALTGIRFFAALHVLFFHNFYLAGDFVFKVPTWLISIFSYGDSAVTFFFVLSGFILSYVYAGADDELKTSKKVFIWARISRIYPIYLLAFLLDLPRGLSYFFQKFDAATAVQKILISAGAHLTMLQSWHPRLTPVWNGPAWSLSAEMFFYLVAPFAIPMIFKSKRNILWLLVLYASPVLLFFLLKYRGVDIASDPTAFTFWRSFPALRITEFFIGIFLGKFYLRNARPIGWMKVNPKLTGYLFSGALLLSLLLISLSLNFWKEIFANLFLLPLFSLMILTLAAVDVRGSGFLRKRWVLLLGGASYALYMIHVPMVYWVGLVFPGSYSLGYFLGYLIVSILLSIVLFKWVEMPCQKWLRKRWL